MSDVEADLRATQDDLQADTVRLHDIEVEKARLDPRDPRARALSDEAEAIARRIAAKAMAERELTDEARAEG
jgi:hypothetical protein